MLVKNTVRCTKPQQLFRTEKYLPDPSSDDKKTTEGETVKTSTVPALKLAKTRDTLFQPKTILRISSILQYFSTKLSSNCSSSSPINFSELFTAKI